MNKKKQQKTRGGLADKVRKSKAASEIKNNPFEVKINRKKFDVLGRKSKHDTGLPGVSRSRAINKRKETLLQEFRLKHKSSHFVDKRFGEYDKNITPEEKILQRFTLERQRTLGRQSVYNLNEEEELTHSGQSLAEVEQMTGVVDSDSDSEEKGRLSAELTASHFGGGGLLKKKGDGDEDAALKAKSRQELIEELIMRSKKDKHERQTQKEETQLLTEKLDQDWRSIHSLLSHKTSKAEKKEDDTDKPKMEDYDVMVRELGFEMKAQPSEKLKSSEELAREERERLQTLEADRLRRMMGDDGSSQTMQHISADDINDGFLLDTDDRKTLAYENGKWNIEEEEGDKDDADEEQNDEEEGAEDDASDDDDGDDDDSESDQSDLQSDAEEEEEEEGDDKQEEVTSEAPPPLSEEQQKAASELPFTFTAPDSYEDMTALLRGHGSEEQLLILERLVACHHPSLSAGNKSKLQKLFRFLLEYVEELTTLDPPDLRTVNLLVPQIYSLCQMFPDAACEAVQTLLSDATHGLEEALEVKGRAAMPGLDMLILLKITALLFPTSDFRHPVSTPAFLYLGLTLTRCAVVSLEDVLMGLALCCVALEFVSLSQRFVPELVNFLLGLLHLTVPDKTSLGYSVVTPFRLQGKHSHLLVLTEESACHSWTRKPVSLRAAHRCSLDSELERDHYRLSVTAACLELLIRCSSLYQALPSFRHIFQPIRTLLLHHFPLGVYPAIIQNLHAELVKVLSADPAQHAPLLFMKKKPIPLKLFTPKIVQILDYGKKRGNTKEQKESERLKHKFKREFKGALREIRKDSKFLAEEKLREVTSRDAERRRKVRELYGSLATQEGEWKALKKRKRK